MALTDTAAQLYNSQQVDAQRLLQAVRSHLGRIARSDDPTVQNAAHQLRRELEKATRR